MTIGQRSSDPVHAALAGIVPAGLTGAVGIGFGRGGLAISPVRGLRIPRSGAPVGEVANHAGPPPGADVIAVTEAVVYGASTACMRDNMDRIRNAPLTCTESSP
ncbi:hypothetical protein DQW77_12515 [Roseovarius sp. TE539]|uniref:hypothetical protein n=1 Tax=Roseovarius sp. TE539 TaxID=2249812 RepID=UPI000DDE01FF|nr:hypothetical protein [Roseovarius sp. TE539]RBI71221.1 hypothetical protein DQW77_12515 [Roseovarius sp. TE539]